MTKFRRLDELAPNEAIPEVCMGGVCGCVSGVVTHTYKPCSPHLRGSKNTSSLQHSLSV